jgi:hypothetical protein
MNRAPNTIANVISNKGENDPNSDVNSICEILTEQMHLATNKRKASSDLQRSSLKKSFLNDSQDNINPVLPRTEIFQDASLQRICYPQSKSGASISIQTDPLSPDPIYLENRSIQTDNLLLLTDQSIQTDFIDDTKVTDIKVVLDRKRSNSEIKMIKVDWTDRIMEEVRPLFATKSITTIFNEYKGRIPLRTLYYWKEHLNDPLKSLKRKNGGQKTKLKPIEAFLFGWFIWKRAEGQIVEDRILQIKMGSLRDSILVNKIFKHSNHLFRLRLMKKKKKSNIIYHKTVRYHKIVRYNSTVNLLVIQFLQL